MVIKDFISINDVSKKAIKRIKSLKNGEGLTKIELAKEFNCQCAGSVEKWMRQNPELKEYRVYIPINSGQNYTAIFVNPKYKAELLKNGSAKENY